MDLLLHAEDIHASYEQRRILKGVSFSLHRGEILGLIGTNGAGKSTLMGVLSGSHRYEGSIALGGENYVPETLEEAQACGVGLIPQNFRLDPELTVAQSIYRGTFQADKPHDALRDQARALIEEVGADLDPDAKIGTLVRAEQSLVEVLRMVAEEAQLVIMDEVAASLPDHDVAILHRVIRMLTEQGRAIIYITHRLDEVRSIAHRIAILRDGQVYKLLSAGDTSPDELAFLLLQQKLEKNPRPVELVEAPDALRVSGLSVREQVRNVSFNVARGEIFGLVGTHRSGVNQLVDALVGIDPSTSGEIFVRGERVEIRGLQDAINQKIGYLSDSVNAPGEGESESVVDSLQQGQEGGLELKDEIKQLRGVIELVHRMRINTTNIHGTLSTLSGGDQQKVELAKWMTTDCDVLILSHPSRGIDIGAKEVAYKMLAELADSGVGIILLSADMSELVSWCHRIGVMRDGELIAIEANAHTNEDALVHHMFGEKFSSSKVSRRAKV